MHPTELRYSKEHEWIAVDGDSGTVGITDFAQGELGDIVYVEFPEVGKTFAMNDVVGTVESVKAVSELYTPVGGEVIEVNEALGDAPEKVNADPHGEGWIFKIRIADASQIDSLMDAATYEEHIKK